MVDKSEKFRWLARLGFAARGVVYFLIGYLAVSGARGGNDGAEGTFDYLQQIPLGTPILYACALGLLGYALFRLSSAIFDSEHYGSDSQGIAHRVGHGASGVAHLLLAYTAFQFATGAQSGASGGSGQAQQAASTVLSASLGALVIGAVGLAFLFAAVNQARKAITANFMRRVSPRAPDWVEYLGRAGYAARFVVFLVIGWSLIRSAWFDSSTEVKTLGEAIGSLSDDGLLYTAVAVGLLLFGVFSLFLARYRIIPDLGPQGLRPQFG